LVIVLIDCNVHGYHRKGAYPEEGGTGKGYDGDTLSLLAPPDFFGLPGERERSAGTWAVAAVADVKLYQLRMADFWGGLSEAAQKVRGHGPNLCLHPTAVQSQSGTSAFTSASTLCYYGILTTLTQCVGWHSRTVTASTCQRKMSAAGGTRRATGAVCWCCEAMIGTWGAGDAGVQRLEGAVPSGQVPGPEGDGPQPQQPLLRRPGRPPPLQLPSGMLRMRCLGPGGWSGCACLAPAVSSPDL
jgi:hypothetical protein